MLARNERSLGVSVGNVWAPLRVGAGGFIRGIDIAPDGTMVCRTDTYGGYVWAPGIAEPGPSNATGMWQQLVTPSSMPANDPTNTIEQVQSFVANQGTYAVKIAPSNSSIFYMAYLGYMYKSTNKGAAWTRLTNFAAVTSADMASNSNFSECGPRMVIDPANSSIAFLGLNTNAAWKTLDGGATWTSISTGSLPAPSPGGSFGIFFAYDPRVSTQSGGVSQIIFAHCYGTGFYKSTDAGANWTKISGAGTSQTTLTTCRRMIVNPGNGDLWATDNATGTSNLWKYSGSTWTNFTAATTLNSGNPYHAIAFDPTIANRIVISDTGGLLTQTPDNGATWIGSNFDVNGNNGFPQGGIPAGLVATDIPYLATEGAGTGFFDTGNIVFDANGKLWIAEGVGVWWANVPTSFASPTWKWNSQSAGIEQLVSNMLVSPPSGDPIAAFWDRPVFRITNPKVYRSTYFPAVFTNAPGSMGVDYASATPSFIVSARSGATLDYSSDGGTTWNSKSMPGSGSGGGCIAASTTTAFVFAESGNGTIFNTTDGGTNWTDLTSYFTTNFGIPANTGWAGFSYSQNIQIVCADRVDANTLYVFNQNTSGNGGGVYMSTNGGSAWTKQAAAPFPTEGGNQMLRSVPGKSGHLFYTGGQGYNTPHPQAYKLWRSTDHGANWADANALLREVWAFGFGKQVGSYPTVFAWGWYNNVPGVWMSTDNCVSFTKIGEQTTYGTFDAVRWVEGDANTAGVCYVMFLGSGAGYYGP